MSDKVKVITEIDLDEVQTYTQDLRFQINQRNVIDMDCSNKRGKKYGTLVQPLTADHIWKLADKTIGKEPVINGQQCLLDFARAIEKELLGD